MRRTGTRRTVRTNSGSKARAAAVTAARGTNKAVKRVYKRYTKPLATLPKTNSAAIGVIARQVRKLQARDHGPRQWQHQHLKQLASYPAGTPNFPQNDFMVPMKNHPFAFQVNDFYPDASGTYYGYLNSNIPTYGHAQNWVETEPNLGFADNWMWNAKQAKEAVSHQHYLPLSSKVKIDFECTTQGPGVAPITVRVTMFKLKRGLGAIAATLPTTLGAYKNMISVDPSIRNHFNTAEYHTILSDQWFTFKQTDVTKNNVRKTIMVRYTNPSNKEVKMDQTDSPPNQAQWTNQKVQDQVWCLISSDTADGSALKVRAERWNVWRDLGGIGS